MSKKPIEFDDSLFQHKIRKLAKKWNVDEKEFIREQGALFIRDLTRFVPPYKVFPTGKSTSIGSAKDKKAGELAIEYDLKKIFYVIESKKFFTALQKRFGRNPVYYGKNQIGAGTLDDIAAMRAFHNKNRNTRNGRTIKLKQIQKMVVSKTMFKKYYAKEKADVGIAKASMAEAALKLNPKTKVPVWVRKQMNKSTGTARVAKIGKSWTAVFKAIAYGLQHVSGSTIRIVQKGRLKAMETRLKHVFKQTAKQSGWKVR